MSLANKISLILIVYLINSYILIVHYDRIRYVRYNIKYNQYCSQFYAKCRSKNKISHSIASKATRWYQ